MVRWYPETSSVQPLMLSQQNQGLRTDSRLVSRCRDRQMAWCYCASFNGLQSEQPPMLYCGVTVCQCIILVCGCVCRALVYGGSICTATDVAVRLGKLTVGQQGWTSGDSTSPACRHPALKHSLMNQVSGYVAMINSLTRRLQQGLTGSGRAWLGSWM